MTEVTIDPSKKVLSVEVKSMSMHAIGFDIVVYDTDKTTKLEILDGTTKEKSTWKQNLAKEASFYIIAVPTPISVVIYSPPPYYNIEKCISIMSL